MVGQHGTWNVNVPSLSLSASPFSARFFSSSRSFSPSFSGTSSIFQDWGAAGNNVKSLFEGNCVDRHQKMVLVSLLFRVSSTQLEGSHLSTGSVPDQTRESFSPVPTTLRIARSLGFRLHSRAFVIAAICQKPVQSKMAGFYLDPISKSSVLMSLVVLVGILGIALHPVQGSLMGKGLLLNSHHNDRPKPWDIHRRPNNYYHYDPVEESYWQPSEPTQDDDGEEPCVGLCYYRKLMNLENKMDGERRENEPIPEEIVFEELTTHKPCVGLCQYYRSLGIENPYEKRQVKRFALHSGGF